MKNKFFEYYYLSPEQQEQIIQDNGEDTLYVFDTNVFLSLYDATKTTAEITLKTLEYVARNSWMPYQVGFEFHRNRKKKFDDRASVIKDGVAGLKTHTDKIRETFKSELLFNNELNPELKTILDELSSKGNEILEQKLAEAKEMVNNDSYLTHLENIYSNDKIGNPLDKKQYETLKSLVDKQWAQGQGVGSKDVKAKGGQFSIYPGNYMFCHAYGDPVIIEEIRNEVVRRNDIDITIKNVVFVSNDQKTDFITELANGQKAPQLYLQRYMCTATEDYPKPLNQFIQVSWADFFHCIKSKLESVSEEEITEAEHEMEILFPQVEEVQYLYSNVFNNTQNADAMISKDYELQLKQAVFVVRRLSRLKEIYEMHDKDEPFELVKWHYTQAQMRNGKMHWEDAHQALAEYEYWLKKYGYDQIGEMIEIELNNAQKDYFGLTGMFYKH